MNDDEIYINDLKTSVEHIKDLGKNAIATDGAFVAVSRAFETFVRDYGSQFPALSQFLARWKGYHTTWTNTVQESRDFAAKTSAEYPRFDELYHIFVQALEDKEDLKAAIEALAGFSKDSHTYIPIDFSISFKFLRDDLKIFGDYFDRYLKQKKNKEPELAEKVKELKKLFAALDPEFKIISDGLKVFAQTWKYFHVESKKFTDVVKILNDVKDFPSIFKSEADLARAIAMPLEERLNAYAQAG
jgi:hypothetical protein